MKELERNIQKEAENLIKKIMERAERIKQREFALAKKKEEGLILKEKEKINSKLEAERNSLKAQMILEFRLKEENFKYSLARDLLEETKKKIASLDENSLLVSLKNLIREAVINLGLKKAYILVNKRDEAILKEHYDEVINFVREKVEGFEIIGIEGSLNTWGGVVVKVPSSPEFFDNTFPRRFERLDEEFMNKILTVLD